MDNKSFNLNKKRILLIGATGVLGATYAKALKEEGCRLVIFDHPETNINDFSKELGVKGIELDLLSESNVVKAIEEAFSILGGFDGVINNAAATGELMLKKGDAFSPFEDYPLELWMHGMNVNLTGTFLICREAGKYMKSHGGSIINISSTYGFLAPDHRIYKNQKFKSMPSYSASKAGVLGLTKWLSTWWAEDNIRVNSVSPGGVFNDHDDEFVSAYSKRTPMNRMANREELIGMILFLLSDLSSYCTGQNYIVDGGYSAW